MKKREKRDRVCVSLREHSGAAQRNTPGSGLVRLLICLGLAVVGQILASEEFACPDGNFGRTGVFAGTGPEQKPDGWKLLVRPVDSGAGNFLVFGGNILTVSRDSLTSTNFQGERLWGADIALPGRRFKFMSGDLHQILGWRDKVIVVSLNGAVKAFGLDDGRPLWSVPGGGLIHDGSHLAEYSNRNRIPYPVAHKNVLLIPGERVIRRLSLEDGAELKPFGFLEEEKGRVTFTSPLAASDSTLFFSAMIEKPETGHFYAIDLESGKLSWKHHRGAYRDTILVGDKKVVVIGSRIQGSDPHVDNHFSAPLVCYDSALSGFELPMKELQSAYGVGDVLHEGALFVRQGRELSKVDIQSNRKLWKYRSKQNSDLLLVMGGGVIYAYEKYSEGRIDAINAADGNLLWTDESNPGLSGREILIPSNGALFCLSSRGIEVLGAPVETQAVPEKDGGLPSDPAEIRREIEDIDRQMGELRKEWEECKLLLAEARVTADATEESKARSEAAYRRTREIAEKVPLLKARRAELEKLPK